MKNLKVVMLVLVLIVGMMFSVSGFAIGSDVRVEVNGKALVMDVKPVIDSGRTLVPMRVIFEALGVDVEWDGEKQQVLSKFDGKPIVLTIGEKKVNNKGVVEYLDVSPKVVDGRTLIPLRFVAEALERDVEWVAEKWLVVITDKVKQLPLKEQKKIDRLEGIKDQLKVGVKNKKLVESGKDVKVVDIVTGVNQETTPDHHRFLPGGDFGEKALTVDSTLMRFNYDKTGSFEGVVYEYFNLENPNDIFMGIRLMILNDVGEVITSAMTMGVDYFSCEEGILDQGVMMIDMYGGIIYPIEVIR